MTYWLLQLLPDWLFHLILLLGGVGITASFVLSFIPFVTQYKTTIQILSVLLLVVGVYYEGAISNNAQWEQKVTELQIKLAKAEKDSAELNTLLIEELLSKEKSIVEINNLNKKYLDSIKTKVDKECKIGSDVINLHNSAARNVGTK